MSTLKHLLFLGLLFLASACSEKREVLKEPASAPSVVSADSASLYSESGLESIVVTASKVSTSRGRPASTVGVFPPDLPHDEPPKPETEIQAGTITAADYDDLLNSQLYLDYASKFLQNNKSIELPFLDLKQGLIVTVKDPNGRAVGGLSVDLIADGKSFKTVKTANNGVVRLYPDHDKLPKSFELKVQDREAKMLAKQKVTLAGIVEQGSLTINIDKPVKPRTQFDLALVIDTTGSMGDELAYLKKELRAIVNSINEANSNLDIKVGLVVYRDTSDDYVTRQFDFMNVEKLITILGKQSYGGGGDYPEAMDQALEAANKLSWRAHSTKVMLLVADAPPHDQNSLATWKQAELARTQQIHIVPVAASGVGDKAQYLMRAMAALTQSRYIFLTDDSGVGNAHAEPSVNCYVVSRLDNLITRVVNGLILGQRVEAKESDIIRRKGNYENGVCADIDNTKQELD